MLTNYTLNLISTSPSEAIDILHELFLHFCYELALETSGKHSSMKSLRVHDLCHANSLANLQWSGPSDRERFSRLKTVYSARNGAHKEAKEPYLHPFVSKRREMAKSVPTKAFLQPAKAAAMSMAARGEPTHLPLSHLFC